MKKELLLSLLETNARYSTRDLADVLLEDEESVIHTMSDLEKKKVICGYHTIINWEKTNKDKVMALIEVDVTPERDFGYDRVAKNIYRYPEVDTMYLMSGKSEFIVIIYGIYGSLTNMPRCVKIRFSYPQRNHTLHFTGKVKILSNAAWLDGLYVLT